MVNLSLRILHVIDAFQLGGAERVAARLATGHAARGHRLMVAAVKPGPAADHALGDALRQELAEAGVAVKPVLGFGSRRVAIATAAAGLLRQIVAWRPDILHSHADIADFVTSIAVRLRPTPVARTIHNSVLWPTHTRLARIAESGFRGDLVVAISRAAAEAHRDLRGRLGLPLTPHLRQIANGTPLRPLPEARAPAAGAEQIQLMFAGRFAPQKGLDILLDALASLSEAERRRVHLHAYGGGPDEGACRARVAENGLPVTFHPPTPGLAGLFASFDYAVVPSRFEGLGLVAIEGLAAGTPVIATRVAGLDEALPPDWPLFAAVLRRVVQGQVAREALVRAGRAWVEARFSEPAMVAAYEAAYRAHLAAGSPSAEAARAP